MGKIEEYGILAEKYYVEEQQTLLQISKRLNISDKTLYRWKRDNNWEQKRQKFLSSQYNCYSSLQELLLYLSKDALEKIKAGEIPEAASLNFIAKMSEKMPKIKALHETKSQKESCDTGTEIAKLIDEKLCG